MRIDRMILEDSGKMRAINEYRCAERNARGSASEAALGRLPDVA